MSRKKRVSREQKILMQARKEEIQNQINELKDLQRKIEGKINFEQVSSKYHTMGVITEFAKSAAILSGTFVIAGTATVCLFSICGGGFPFKMDQIKKYKEYNFEYYSENDYSLTEKYVNPYTSDSSDSSNYYLNIYTPWEKQEDQYTRIKRDYEIKDNQKEIYEAFINDNLDELDEILDKYTEEIQVTNGPINEEDNNYNYRINMIFYDTDDYIQVEESGTKNSIITFSEFAVIALLEAGVALFGAKSFENLKDEINYLRYSKKRLKKYNKELQDTEEKILSLSKKRGGK